MVCDNHAPLTGYHGGSRGTFVITCRRRTFLVNFPFIVSHTFFQISVGRN